MIYQDVVSMFRSVAEAMPYNIYFNEGQMQFRNLEEPPRATENFMWLLPMESDEDIRNNGVRTYNGILIIYAKSAIDNLEQHERQIIHNMEALGREFFRDLDDIDMLQLGRVKGKPGYKQLDNSYSGVGFTFTISVPDDYVYCPPDEPTGNTYCVFDNIILDNCLLS